MKSIVLWWVDSNVSIFALRYWQKLSDDRKPTATTDTDVQSTYPATLIWEPCRRKLGIWDVMHLLLGSLYPVSDVSRSAIVSWLAFWTAIYGLISLAEDYRLALIRGIPTCGKTTICKIVVNVLLATRPNARVHVLNGWEEGLTGVHSWDNHLKKCTGIIGELWLTIAAFLLFNKCRQSFWDESLWSKLMTKVETVFAGISLRVYSVVLEIT